MVRAITVSDLTGTEVDRPMQSTLRLVVSFAIGLVVMAALWAMYYLLFDAPGSSWANELQVGAGILATIVITGSLLSWPILLSACLLLLLFESSIKRHLGLLSAMAPFAAAIAYVGVDIFTLNKSNLPLVEYLALMPVVSRVGAAFVVSAITAVVFYLWSTSVQRDPNQPMDEI